jgi:hypothetical protein
MQKMWWDELNDPDYAHDTRRKKKDKGPEFFHNSMTSNKPILNAISGEYYYYMKGEKKIPYRIGTHQQGRFYSVVMGDPENRKESCRLFFDTPEQYTSFTGIPVSDRSKQEFLARKYSFNMQNKYELRENAQ